MFLVLAGERCLSGPSFADALETRRIFSIQIAGDKISVPKNAIINTEHERKREREGEEIEFQIKWKN